MNPTNDKIKYKITINAIDQVWKIKINAVLINKNEYLISFVFNESPHRDSQNQCLFSVFKTMARGETSVVF